VVLSSRADGVMVADAIAWVGPVNTLEPEHAANLGAFAATHQFQRAVDAGDEPWRLDPIDAARADAAVLGFEAHDPMQLLESGGGSARVRAEHAGVSYEIRLTQPARLGPTGIWVVEAVGRL
jgi:hypothetical protein